MATEVVTLPVGTPIVRRPPGYSCVHVAPGAAGSVLIEYSNDGVNYTNAPQGTTTTPYSFCPNTLTGVFAMQVHPYIRMTATTTAGVGMVMDYNQVPGPTGYDRKTLALSSVAYAKQSGTAEQACFSMRFPPGFLKPNFRLDWDFCATITNNTDVKTLTVYFGNSATTALEGGTSAWTNVYTSMAGAHAAGVIAGRNVTNSVIASNAGLASAGGWGSSTTANVAISSSADYLNVEQALVFTVTTATTAGDVFTRDSIKVDLTQ